MIKRLLKQIKTKKVLVILLAVLGLFIFALVFPAFSRAANLSDLYKQKNEASKQITEKSKSAQTKKEEAAKLSQELKKLDQEIAAIRAKIKETRSQIEQTEQEIKQTEEEIGKKEEELKIQINNRNEALRVIYENSRTNNLEIIIASSTLSEVVNYNEYLEALEQKIESIIGEIIRLKGELEEKKSALENKKKELDNLKAQQEAYQQGLASQQTQKNKLLGDARSQQKQLEKQVAEAQKLESQVQAEIARILSAQNSSGRAVVARDRGTSAVGFMWPMDYLYISAYWGEPTPFQSFHSGIDLVNVMGTPVYAAANGTIVFTGASPLGESVGYGRYIVIGHNARFSTLYGHLMGFNVSLGQEVKQGEVIGYMGNTGWTTGPHLHFEVREYGNIQNPMGYLP